MSTTHPATRPDRWHTVALACFYAAGIVALIGAVGATLGSIPAIHGRLGVDPETSCTKSPFVGISRKRRSAPKVGGV